MSQLPRDLTGLELAKTLGCLGYSETRTTGSHMRLTHPGPPQHHITIPKHDPLKVGTLSAILDDVASAMKLGRTELMQTLFG